MSTGNLAGFRITAWSRGAFLALALAAVAAGGFGAEIGSPVTTTGKAAETSTQEALRSYLHLQEQLHATQLAIEHNRKEADAAATENAKAFTVRLQGIEQTLASQRTQELEATRSSNKVMLIVAGMFAAPGLLAMLFMAYFPWRTINRLAEIATALPLAHALGSRPPVAALGEGNARLASVGPPEQPNPRLLSALEQLDQRIHQLEHTAHPPPQEGGALAQQPGTASPTNGNTPLAPDAAQIMVLLGKGQSLLSFDQAEEALACFDQVLELDASHAEALVKKGAALERLQKLDEAIACYDRAIAADNGLTVAYLYKGGLFNRMERFGEARECYEQALRKQEDRRG